MSKTYATQVRLPNDLADKIKAKAVKEKRSFNFVVNELLEAQINGVKK